MSCWLALQAIGSFARREPAVALADYENKGRNLAAFGFEFARAMRACRSCPNVTCGRRHEQQCGGWYQES